MFCEPEWCWSELSVCSDELLPRTEAAAELEVAVLRRAEEASELFCSRCDALGPTLLPYWPL